MANAYNKAGADPINEYHINNTEADLMAHLAPGQFGFATDTYSIVVNIPNGDSGVIKVFRTLQYLVLPLLSTPNFPVAKAGEVHIFANSVGQVLKQYENGLIEELVSTDYAGPGAAPGGGVGTFNPPDISFID